MVVVVLVTTCDMRHATGASLGQLSFEGRLCVTDIDIGSLYTLLSCKTLLKVQIKTTDRRTFTGLVFVLRISVILLQRPTMRFI